MMDALEITYRLKRAGLSQTQIARELGVSASVVGNVIHNRITAFEVANHIAGALGEDINTLWPERYTFKPRGRSTQRKAVTFIPPCAADDGAESGGGL
jgi:Ner family transcriptional regulator